MRSSGLGSRFIPVTLARLLATFERPWWICGGWALDLFLDRETRRHDDLDVALLRRDQLAPHDHLSGWDLRYATPEHALERWDGRRLDPPIHGIWARRSDDAAAPWTCEFLLNEERDGHWVYPRDDTVSDRSMRSVWTGTVFRSCDLRSCCSTSRVSVRRRTTPTSPLPSLTFSGRCALAASSACGVRRSASLALASLSGAISGDEFHIIPLDAECLLARRSHGGQLVASRVACSKSGNPHGYAGFG